VPAGDSGLLGLTVRQTARGRHGLVHRFDWIGTRFRVLVDGAVGGMPIGGSGSGSTGGSGGAAGGGAPVTPPVLVPVLPPAFPSTKSPVGPAAPKEAPKKEAPKEAPKEEPKKEAPKEPPKEEPKEEAPKEEPKEAPKETPAGSWWVPPQHLTWYWQLQGTVNNSEPVAAYDIDGFETSASEVATLHAQAKHVICYIDVGTFEPGRSDSSKFPASVQGADVQGWPGEKWLDVSNLAALEPIMTARFQMCKEKGFDAVEPDNMDGFENNDGFNNTAAQQLTYDEWVAGDVHSLGMAVLQKNDGEQTAQLEPHFDGALDEQCNQYAECSNFQAYLTAGKPVLNAEYSSFSCAADNAAGIMGARYDLELDGKTFEPCW
jgi:Glycoside-hydrolase family GH114